MATKPVSRAGRERAKAHNEHLRRVREDWRKRHPARAAEERELLKQRLDREEQFGHKVHGTVETHAKVSVTRQGAMARLYHSGAITMRQWGASLEIAAAHSRIVMSAGVPTSWAIERVDRSMNPQQAFDEALGGVWNEMAYSRWRLALPQAGPVLAMVCEDKGIAAAARQYSMHVRKARRLLTEALDLWVRLHGEVRQEVDEATLAAARAAIL